MWGENDSFQSSGHGDFVPFWGIFAFLTQFAFFGAAKSEEKNNFHKESD